MFLMMSVHTVENSPFDSELYYLIGSFFKKTNVYPSFLTSYHQKHHVYTLFQKRHVNHRAIYLLQLIHTSL